jgi:hypothetical protein
MCGTINGTLGNKGREETQLNSLFSQIGLQKLKLSNIM